MILDKGDLAVLENKDFLLQKKIVSEKILVGLDALKHTFKKTFDELPPTHRIHEYLENNPKISKGENYMDLPYFILDYPRVFTSSETFAIRSMVLWGHFYSFTFHVAEGIQKKIADRLLSSQHHFPNFYICVNETPWEYHYSRNNYIKISDLNTEILQDILHKKPFLKLSIKHNLSTFNESKDHGSLFLRKIFSLIQ